MRPERSGLRGPGGGLRAEETERGDRASSRNFEPLRATTCFPSTIEEGKAYVTIGDRLYRCGRHRSVAIAEAIGARLHSKHGA